MDKSLKTPEEMKGRWLILLAVGIGTFMSALDGSVVNTILPVIEKVFSSGVATIEWIVTIYLLVVSGLLLTFGRLGDLKGQKRFYVTGFMFFITGSALCGLASSDYFLIASRGFQAIGAAMLYANSPAILTKNFPASRRGQALGLQATMTYLGLTVGPSLGGWLATNFSWRAVFYINVPVGVLAIILSVLFIPKDLAVEKQEKFDVTGAIIFSCGLVLLLLALDQGHAWGWLSARSLFVVLGAVALLAIFILLEARVPSPMLDLSLFKNRVFNASSASAVMNYIVLYSSIFLIPFYLEQGLNLNPAQAGLLLTSQPLIMAISAPISGTLSDRIGSRIPATLGMFILGIGMFLLIHLGPDTPLSYVIFSLAICGLGTGIFISPNTSALMGSAPKNRQGIASGILATARNVGMALGVGLAGAIMTTFLAKDSSSFFQAIDAGFFLAMIVAILGSMTSAIRGKDVSNLKGHQADVKE